ncbi:MAG: outer membrane lipoprotein-sorting protein [Pseudomonadota bacterium]
MFKRIPAIRALRTFRTLGILWLFALGPSLPLPALAAEGEAAPSSETVEPAEQEETFASGIGGIDESPFSIEGLSPEAAGEAIFREVDRRESGYQDLKVDLVMILRTAKGSESSRSLRIRQLEVPEDGDRLLVVFDTPKSIRGTALLSYAHKVEPDDQWMYLPALKRVKRIASQNRSGPFLSSEFAYEDMALQEVEKFTYRFVALDERDGEPVFLVERFPTDEHSGYARQLVAVHADAFRIEHIEYFDERDRLLKTLAVSGYQLFEDRYWKAGRMLMSNVQTGKSTELLWEGFEFATGLDADRDFSTNSLRRAR